MKNETMEYHLHLSTEKYTLEQDNGGVTTKDVNFKKYINARFQKKSSSTK